MKQRVCSILLVVIMILTSVDITAFAQPVVETVTTEASEEETSETESVQSEETESVSTSAVESEEESVILEESTEAVSESGEEGREFLDEESLNDDELENSGEIKVTTNMKELYGTTYELEYGIVDFDEYGFPIDESEWYVLIRGYTGVDSGTLYIPAEIEGYPVREVCGFSNASGFTKLIIEEGVLSIEYRAFAECTGFKGELIIPSSVSYIGEMAFIGCAGFSGKLVIPGSVKYVEPYAFFDCDGFSGLEIENGVSQIRTYAFACCDGFSGELVIPSSVGYIWSYAFKDCTGFTGLKLTEGVAKISEGSFYNCTGLTGELTIPASIEVIEESVFYNCSGLERLKIEEGVSIIKDEAFADCTKLSGTLTIPSTVAKVGTDIPTGADTCGAFEGCVGITELVVEEGVEYIGERAFQNCIGLTGKISIPTTVEKIGGEAFQGCVGINELELGLGITQLGYRCFMNCTGINRTLTIPANVKIIGSYAFANCSRIPFLQLEEGVNEIVDGAFRNCTGLTGKLTIPASVSSIGDLEGSWGAFEGCSGIEELEILSGVSVIGNCSFKNCTGLTGQLKLPSSVIEIGNGAFKECKGLTGELYIPEGVTMLGDIEDGTWGEGVFEGCIGFTGKLIIPNSVTEIGAKAFKNCTGFTRELTIADSVKEIGFGAFENCTGLIGELILPSGLEYLGESAFYGDVGFYGDLTIPSTIDYIEDNVFNGCSGLAGTLRVLEGVQCIEYGAFVDCIGIEKIYLPESITEISYDAFRKSNYGRLDVIMYCPIDSYAYNWALENGFEVVGLEKASKAAIQADPTKHTIHVYDSSSEEPISSASITIGDSVYITSEEGIVAFSATDEEVKTDMLVMAEGYLNVETVQNVKNGIVSRIGMMQDPDAIVVTSVMAELGEDKYDFLREKLVLGYYADKSKITSEEEKNLKITVKSNQPASKYEIITEDGACVLSSDNGVFNISTITSGKNENGNTIKSSMPLNNVIEHGKKYYIRVTDSEGNIGEKRIGLSATVNYATEENVYQKGSFKLGDSFEIKIADDVPLIGGGTYKFGFPKALSLEMSVDESGIVKIAYNKPVDQELNVFKEKYKGLEKRAYRNSKKIFNDMPGAVSSFGAGFFDVDGKICGYGEGNISELDKGKISIEIGIIAEIEGKGGYKQYFFVGVVPINVFVEGSAKGTFNVEGSVDVQNWKIIDWDISNGSINVKVALTGGAGVGVGVEVNASLTGSANYIWKPAREYQKAWLEASGKITGGLGPFEKTLWESKTYKYTIKEVGKDQPLDLNIASVNEMINSNVSFQAISRNYLNYSEGYNSIYKVQSVNANNLSDKTILKEAVYPVASPQMVEVNGAKYLFWLEDITSRNKNNRTALVYSKSVNDLMWSEPVRLISEAKDETLDSAYSLYVDGENIYITWQDAVRKITEEDDVLSYAKELSVRRAVLDTQTDTVVDNVCLTTSAGYYMYPCTVAAGTECYSAFVHNELNSNDILGNNVHHLYCVKGATGELKELDIPSGAQIINMDGGIFDGDARLACELDTDGDIATSSDREIYLYNLKDDNYTVLSNNDVEDTVPVIADSGNIYWYQGSDFVSVKTGESTASALWETSQVSSQSFYVVITDGNGKDTILWEATDAASEDGSIAIYQTVQNADGSWGNVTKCLETNGTVASKMAAAGLGEDLQIAFLEGVFLEDGSALKDLCVASRKEVTDIALEYVTYNEEDDIPGNSLPLQVTVINNGNTTVNDVTVSVEGQAVATLSELNLLAGESREIEVNGFSVPLDLSTAQTYSVKVFTAGEENTSDNQDEILLGSSDVYTETTLRLEDESTCMDIYLRNENSYAAKGTLKVHKGTEDGEVICEKKFTDIDDEKGYAYTLNLGDYEAENVNYYVEVVTDSEENNEGNNTEFVYIGYGTGVEQSLNTDISDEASYLSLNREQLELEVGDTFQFEVSADGDQSLLANNLLWVSSDKRVVSVGENGKIKAHRAGKAQIAVYYGEISATCNVIVSEEFTQTVSLQFDTQGGTRIEPILGIIPGNSVTIPENVLKNGYVFNGWYTLPVGGEKIEGTTLKVDTSMTLYAQWIEEETTNGLWIQSIPDQVYTGKAIKPKVAVYNGETLLKEKKDYTISYKNNVKANDAAVLKNAPTIIVKGKGNYSGKETTMFRIVPKAIYASDIQAEDIIVKYNGKVQKVVPTIIRDGKKLKNKTDFTVEYPDLISDNPNAYKEPGTYTILIKGKGGYTGEREIMFTITENKLMSKVSVAKIKNQLYTGTEIKPSLTVKNGKIPLTEGIDYKAEYLDNVEIGTATVILSGMGSYSGTKKVTFKITGGNIKKAKVMGIPKTVPYDGTAITIESGSWGQEPLLTAKINNVDITLREGIDYAIEYQKNTDKGTAAILFKGINGFSGTLKKTFKITSYDIEKDDLSCMDISMNTQTKYTKGGSKPKPVVKFENTILEEGKDYTLSYKNHTKVNDGSNEKKVPTVTIKGKGNFSGKISGGYTIEQQSLSVLNITLPDKAYKQKKNAYKSKPKITELDGKVLKAGTDYEKAFVYSYKNETTLDNGTVRSAGEIVDADDIVPAGTVIVVTVTGKGSYLADTLSGEYRVVKADISKARVSVVSQIYTGSAIVPAKDQIIVKLNGITLNETDYEIVKCENNIKKGNAKITIKGVDNYGGSKTVTFKIKSKGLLWWWR